MNFSCISSTIFQQAASYCSWKFFVSISVQTIKFNDVKKLLTLSWIRGEECVAICSCSSELRCITDKLRLCFLLRGHVWRTAWWLWGPSCVVNLPCEALHGRFDQRLSAHVSDQVLNRTFGLWPVCLAAEVDGDQWTCLYEWMCQKHLQEQAQLLASLL